MDFTMLTWFALGGKWQVESLLHISKGNPDFFVNYVRQVVYGFLYELQFTVHQILVSEELIYVKCLKKFILKNKMIKTCAVCDFF
uniref:Uncharacterized protein n=3 Tax=Passeriformes TaxID=9126 RepID=A0A803V7E0_FICAL